MMNEIDPNVVEFIQSITDEEVRNDLLRKYVTKESQLRQVGNKQAIFTPGENGSLIAPRMGEMPIPTLLQALENKRKKRSQTIATPEIMQQIMQGR